MFQEIAHKKNNEYFYAGIIFAIIIFSVYAPVIFLDQTFLINMPVSIEHAKIQEKSQLFGITVDSGMQASYPDIKLASKMLLEGELPLWNPYLGTGFPLAADTTHHIFSPVSLGFLLPVELWDIPLMIILWIAGFSTFIFLRNLGLNFTSSLCGGIFYMLSGAFTWYITNPNPPVTMMTPLILFSIDKILRNNNPKYIFLLSISFGISILGGHLQSLFLQSILVVCYSGYRVIQSYFIDKQKIEITKKYLSIPTNKFILKVILGLLGGIGLVSFYIFYMIEFLRHGILDISIQYGTVQYSTLSIATLILPNILGNITRTWTTNVEWVSYFGHIGAFAIFFTIVSLFYISKKTPERFTPIFFLLLSFIVLLRLVNTPIISSITTLPIFNMLALTTYSGVIITFGFTIAAAFGINYVMTEKISKKNIFYTMVITLSLLGILLTPIMIELSSEYVRSDIINDSDIQKYIIFQIIQAVFFIFIAGMISFTSIKKPYIFLLLPFFLVLELSLYLPFGLHPIWVAYKFIIVSIAMISLFLISKFVVINKKKILWILLFVITGTTLLGHTVISEQSPYGMPTRHDSFGENDLVDFLKNNLNHQRIFSFEKTMRADYPAGFDISSIGLFSSFHINDHHTFSQKFLDKDVRQLGVGGDVWVGNYGIGKSINKFLENEKYFDFLGVKYIITEGYNFNTIAYGTFGKSGNFIPLTTSNDTFYQIFNSPLESIETFGMYFFTESFEKNDQIILTINSIPYESKYHRVISLNEINNMVINEFEIIPPISNALDKKFKFSLHYPQTTPEKNVVIYYDEKELSGITDNIKYYFDKTENKEIFVPFAITPVEKKFPMPFKFHDIYINENIDAFPRAYLVHEFISVPVDTAQEFLLKNNKFDLRNSVILESKLLEHKLDNLESTSYERDLVEIIEFNENDIKIETFSEHDSILILTDVYYPGWEVLVDGKQSEILRANGLVRAVVLEEGNHIVEFNYIPKSFWVGVVISVATIIGFVGVYIYSKNYKINESNK